MKKKLVLLVLIALAVAGAFFALKHKREAVAARPAAGIPPVVLESRRLEAGPAVLTRPVSAEVLALRDAVLASRFSAYVLELPRYEGERVKKGEVLARLDVSQAEADLARAEAQLAETRLREGSLAAELAAARALAQSEADRAERLAALERLGGAALEQVQAAQAAQAAAQARLAAAQSARDNYRALLHASEAQARAARENLGYAVIRAPFDGVVTQRLAQAGDLAAPGKPLVKLMDTGAGVRLLVSLPQDLPARALQVDGQRLALKPWPEAVGQGMARFEARAGGHGFGMTPPGRHVPPASLSPNPSPASGRGEFRESPRDGQVKAEWLPGARVDARLEVFRAEAALVIPRDCLLAVGDGRARLVRLDGGRAVAVAARLAAEGDEGVALADQALDGAEIACASPDILARALAGAPLTVHGPSPQAPPPGGEGRLGPFSRSGPPLSLGERGWERG